jgi:hypothetical protein
MGDYLPRENTFGQTCRRATTVSFETRHPKTPGQGGLQQVMASGEATGGNPTLRGWKRE